MPFSIINPPVVEKAGLSTKESCYHHLLLLCRGHVRPDVEARCCYCTILVVVVLPDLGCFFMKVFRTTAVSLRLVNIPTNEYWFYGVLKTQARPNRK